MDDKHILNLLFDRSEQALAILAQKFGPRLLSTARNILGDDQDAEECVSDTYLALWNAIPPKKPDPLAGFVLKTGRNLALKRLRHNTAAKGHRDRITGAFHHFHRLGVDEIGDAETHGQRAHHVFFGN